ncbi:MAG: ABC transporter permease [Bacteroidota bacterium]
MANSPPKFWLRFFRWYCHPDYLEDLEGDLLERFESRVEEKSLRSAKWNFVKDVIRLFRPGIIRPLIGNKKLNNYSLLIHNLRLTLRIISKDRLHSVINFAGLAIGFAAFLFIFQYVRFEKGFDSFHENNADLYRINYQYFHDNELQRSLATSPPRLASFIKEQFPEVESVVRVHSYEGGDLTIGSENRVFRENNILFADPAFFNMFSFPLLEGDTQSCLEEVRTMVITESASKKYFGDQSPLGKTVAVDGSDALYTITGVLADPPVNSHLQFDVLISYKTLNWWYEGDAENSWYWHNFHTYILLNPKVDLSNFEVKLASAFKKARGEINEKKAIDQHFYLQPLGEIHFDSGLENILYPEKQADRLTLNFLLAIGYFIICIAWVNYINLTTARSIKRAKEVGIKKTLGLLKKQLVVQFMIESFAMNLVAAILAIILVVSGHNFLTNLVGTSFNISYLLNSDFWSTSIAFILAGALISGGYPAFVLSAYKPVKVLKGSLASKGSGAWLRRVLVVFQFAISVGLIISTAFIFLQLDYMKSKDIGFNANDLLIVRGPNELEGEEDYAKQKLFANELSNYSKISKVTVSSAVPGEVINDPVNFSRYEEANMETFSFDFINVSFNYFETFEIELLAGRGFNPQIESDHQAIVLNEAAVRLLGFDSTDLAIGEKVLLNDKYQRTIIGVAESVNQLSSKYAVAPMAYDLDENASFYYVIRYSDAAQHTLNQSQKIFERFYPNDPFDFFFLDEYYNRQYVSEYNLSHMITFFSSLAIFIACLGLLGLASYNTLRRTREIGIRKVLGATVKNVVYMLSKEFLLLTVIANLITWPLVYWLVGRWLNNFASRIEINFSVFLISGLSVVVLALFTITSLTLKAAQSNPVHALRNE